MIIHIGYMVTCIHDFPEPYGEVFIDDPKVGKLLELPLCTGDWEITEVNKRNLEVTVKERVKS